MKKIKIVIVGLLLFLTFMVGQTTCFAAEKKINVYLFKGEGCPHCEEALEWFKDTLANDSDYSNRYKLVEYEVWYDEDNSKLMNDVAEELDTKASGVPFIVIGDKFFSGFASDSSPDEIKSAIETAYNNDKYEDVVAAVKKGKKINKDSDNSSIIPVVIVSAIAIVVVLGLVFFTKEKE
jgi:glutaredoxin